MMIFVNNNVKRVLTIMFLVSLGFWIYFVLISGYKAHPLGIATQWPLFVIPFYGAWVGLMKYGKKTMSADLGAIVSILSLAILLFGIGTAIWTYYVWQEQSIPYPSLADFIYVWSPVLWVIGFLLLSRLVGGFGFRSWWEFFMGVITAVIVAIATYFLLVVYAHGNRISADDSTMAQVFFDYAYTGGAMALMIIITAAWFMSYRRFGGKYFESLRFLSAGFVAHFIAIVIFVSTITRATYFNGNAADLFFTIAVYLEAMGIAELKS